MNRILVDFGRYSTTLWFKDGFISIKGDLMEIAEKIYNIATVKIVNKKTGVTSVEQEYELYIDYFGYGQPLEDVLKNRYDLKVERCKNYKNHKDYNCDEQQVIEVNDELFKFIK